MQEKRSKDLQVMFLRPATSDPPSPQDTCGAATQPVQPVPPGCLQRGEGEIPYTADEKGLQSCILRRAKEEKVIAWPEKPLKMWPD